MALRGQQTFLSRETCRACLSGGAPVAPLSGFDADAATPARCSSHRQAPARARRSPLQVRPGVAETRSKGDRGLPEPSPSVAGRPDTHGAGPGLASRTMRKFVLSHGGLWQHGAFRRSRRRLTALQQSRIPKPRRAPAEHACVAPCHVYTLVGLDHIPLEVTGTLLGRRARGAAGMGRGCVAPCHVYTLVRLDHIPLEVTGTRLGRRARDEAGMGRGRGRRAGGFER